MQKLAVLTWALGIVVMILVGAIVVIVRYPGKQQDTKPPELDLKTKKDILYFYGNFFRTIDQQRKKELKTKFIDVFSKIVKKTKQVIPKNINLNSLCSKFTAFLNKTLFPFLRERRQSSIHTDRFLGPELYHGCCTSRRKYVSPDTAVCDDDGLTYQLVQFKTTHRQYFLSEDCNHKPNCPMDCGCYQQMGFFRALVKNPLSKPPYVVRLIRIPGGCKCFNGIPAPVEQLN